MTQQTVDLSRLTHKLLCAFVAVELAAGFIHGEFVRLYTALAGVALMLTWALASGSRSRSRVPPRPLRRARTPSFHDYMMDRLGDPRRPAAFLSNFFLRPLLAGSFGEFWQRWNPPYQYVLLFYIYRPLRKVLPRPVARYLTFLASGYFLHDLPFNGGIGAFTGHPETLKVTLLFAVFGALAQLSEMLPLDLTRSQPTVRVTANLLWLGAGYSLRGLLLSALGL